MASYQHGAGVAIDGVWAGDGIQWTPQRTQLVTTRHTSVPSTPLVFLATVFIGAMHVAATKTDGNTSRKSTMLVLNAVKTSGLK
jgi:hypothetical protein